MQPYSNYVNANINGVRINTNHSYNNNNILINNGIDQQQNYTNRINNHIKMSNNNTNTNIISMHRPTSTSTSIPKVHFDSSLNKYG